MHAKKTSEDPKRRCLDTSLVLCGVSSRDLGVASTPQCTEARQRRLGGPRGLCLSLLGSRPRSLCSRPFEEAQTRREWRKRQGGRSVRKAKEPWRAARKRLESPRARNTSTREEDLGKARRRS
uniref:Uncharacterized protein n=1 Tax=Neospora caninum (strain Liverpool) TaxID=572307 RepID=A0A0F7UH50_NEOCL|nr:TPA: hypothetical protein BN1204_033795 [Neospora caninum Liverpool]